MKRKHDILVYDERERYPHSLFSLSLLLSAPFVYLAVSRVILALLILKGQCTYSPLESFCPALPWATIFFDTFSFLHAIYDRTLIARPELKYLPLVMYVMAVLIAFVPFMVRNYRAGRREYVLLSFLALGALCTLVVR